ncbi:MAG: hypothetical protein H6713_37530 [Myxococcales bacterium]|nr:hypothetical protein [Myxococcales bacterium]
MSLAVSLSILAWPVHGSAASFDPGAAYLLAKKKKSKKAEPTLTPEKAESQRNIVRDKAKARQDAGDQAGAAEALSDEAHKLGDPVLFVDAAETYKIAGDEARSIELVEQGIEEARIGLDILYFLLGERADKGHQYLAEDDVSTQIDRARDIITSAEALIGEIEAEQNAEPEPEPEPEKKPRDGKGMIIAGAVLTGVGVAGLGVMGAGVGMGASAQGQVNDPTVYGTTFDEVDRKGKLGNTLAFVGVGVGVVGLAAGVTLLALGLKKRKQSGASAEEETARVRVVPAFNGQQGGLVLTGRF